MSPGAPPRPVWITLPGVLLQLVGVFVLPFAVGVVAAAMFDVAEVVETGPALLAFTALVLLPVSLAQVLGLLFKSWRELAYWRARRGLGVARLLDVLFTHLRVVTARGWSLLGMSLAFVFFALWVKWASLGTLAAFGLLLFYVLVGWTIFTSTFFTRTFEASIGRAHAGIERQIQPAVCLAGADADEVFRFRRTPIPWGYVLLVEEILPARLKTESRYQVGAAARGAEVERRGRLRATPRGVYLLGPARLWYQDLLGITRISVASLATAELKVLPPIRPVEVIEPPRSDRQTPDIRTRPHRFPTEDHFRFQEYAAGDDTRRIHWRLSMRTGRMQVRKPETREIHRRDVLIAIDSYIARGQVANAASGADDLLDAVVEAALGIARTLVDAGDRVTLLAAALAPDHAGVRVEVLDARPGTATRWQDLGARVRWQNDVDLPDLLAGHVSGGHVAVVSARFSASPPAKIDGVETSWIFLDPAEALGPPDRHWLLQVLDRPGGPWLALFTRPHPVGSDENAWVQRVRNAWSIWRLWRARRALRRLAGRGVQVVQSMLAARGDAVYRIERTPTRIRIRGVAGGGGLSG